MRILLAAMWLLLDAARSWVAWHTRGVRRRLRRRRENAERRPESAVRTFTNPTVDDWARAADRAAAEALATTRPGTVRRVVVH